MAAEFWKSSGYHLTTRNDRGWHEVTPDLIRAYLARPEIHPVDESCANEVAVFEALMADPFRPVSVAELAAFADSDAADNYRIVVTFRDLLARTGTLETAYLEIMQAGRINLPPVFIDQMVHIILRGIFTGQTDPMRLRAAELFFREQTVTTEDGRVMLGDQEIIEMQGGVSGLGTIAKLLEETGTPARRIDLDVLTDENAELYWQRSERFDTVIDMRFGHPANHAFARVIEAWINHFLALNVRVQPARSIRDEAWRWHIGLDRDATDILNALYEGREVCDDVLTRLIALYRLEIVDQTRVMEDVQGKPVYLALGSSAANRVRVKPQNLLVNLPLAPLT